MRAAGRARRGGDLPWLQQRRRERCYCIAPHPAGDRDRAANIDLMAYKCFYELVCTLTSLLLRLKLPFKLEMLQERPSSCITVLLDKPYVLTALHKTPTSSRAAARRILPPQPDQAPVGSGPIKGCARYSVVEACNMDRFCVFIEWCMLRALKMRAHA